MTNDVPARDLGGPFDGDERQAAMPNIRRLPTPTASAWEWQLYAACRGMDGESFFHPEGERGRARADREARAKQICVHCPVLEQCRRHALATEEPYGVWGGLSEADRVQLLNGGNREIRLLPTPSRRATAMSLEPRAPIGRRPPSRQDRAVPRPGQR